MRRRRALSVVADQAAPIPGRRKPARVAGHARSGRVGSYATVVEYMPAAHRAHLEWMPQRLIHWEQQIGAATGALVTRLLQERRHPEHG